MVPYAYLIGSLSFVAAWGLLYLRATGARRAMLWTSLLLAPAGPISQYWHLQDYWGPAHLVRVELGAWRFGAEDYLFTFGFAGLASGLFEVQAQARGLPPPGPFSRWVVCRMVGFGTLGLALMALGASGFQWNSLYAGVLAIFLPAILMVGNRRELWWLSLATAAEVAALFWLFYWALFIPLFPGVIEAWWRSEGVSGLRVMGVPLEEPLWAFFGGLFAGPAFRCCAGDEGTLSLPSPPR
ncbi:MAG: lycopene cyclase domain-containing protein [Nitrospinota bacterium]